MLAFLPDNLPEFYRQCHEVADWEALLECAGRHGVEGILGHALTVPGSPLPGELQARCEQQRVFARLAQSRLHSALDEVLRVFAATPVRAVSLKGPVLGERLYPEPAARPATDLDFLVSPEALETAVAALATIGYQPLSGAVERFYEQNHHHYSLYRRHSPTIELHFRAYRGFEIAVPAGPPLSRALPHRTVRGHETWLLAPEDELLFLCLHAAGHCYVRLAWLYEIKLLLRRYPNLDWAAVGARARALRVVTPVAFTLEALRHRLGATAASPLGPSLPARRRRVAAYLMGVITSGRFIRTSKLAGILRLLFRAALCDHPAAAARLLGRELFRIAWKRAHRAFPWAIPEESMV